MSKSMRKKKKALFLFMEFYDDSSASDGAWQAMLKDSVEFFNEENGTDYDPFDSWQEYIQWSK